MTFSHIYRKLLTYNNSVIKKSKILEVIPIEIENLSKEFLNYDSENKYNLPKKGKFIIIILLKEENSLLSCSNIFTTIRPWTEEKEKYYRERIGETINIEHLKKRY